MIPAISEMWIDCAGEEYLILDVDDRKQAYVCSAKHLLSNRTYTLGLEKFDGVIYRLKGSELKPIAEGSVVQLKSGGPPMTVARIVDDKADVLYVPEYGMEGTIREAMFPLVALKPYEEPKDAGL